MDPPLKKQLTSCKSALPSTRHWHSFRAYDHLYINPCFGKQRFKSFYKKNIEISPSKTLVSFFKLIGRLTAPSVPHIARNGAYRAVSRTRPGGCLYWSTLKSFLIMCPTTIQSCNRRRARWVQFTSLQIHYATRVLSCTGAFETFPTHFSQRKQKQRNKIFKFRFLKFLKKFSLYFLNF